MDRSAAGAFGGDARTESPQREQRTDATATETLGLGAGDGGAGGTDDDQAPEPASARRAFLPSSIGISVLTPSEMETLAVTVTWGDYASVSVPRTEEVVDPVDGGARTVWQRTARTADVTVAVGRSQVKPKSYLVPGSDGLELRVSVRPVKTPEGDGPRLAPRGSRAVSVFLVNRRAPREDRQKDQTMVFQAALRVTSDRAFVPRPNLRGHSTGDWDEQVADLQYRDSFEWAVGRGVATSATVGPDDACREVSTTWVPTAEVARVEP